MISFNSLINVNTENSFGKNGIEYSKIELFLERNIISQQPQREKWVFEQGRGVYKENGEVETIEGLIIDISIQKEKKSKYYI